jgi:hypothetical protein
MRTNAHDLAKLPLGQAAGRCGNGAGRSERLVRYAHGPIKSIRMWLAP